MSINGIIEVEQQPLCQECREAQIPVGSVTGLCYSCEEYSNEPNDYTEEL